jgi:hypothetical protein
MSSLQATHISEVACEPSAAKDDTWPLERSTSNGQARHTSAMYTSAHEAYPLSLISING